MEFDVVINSQPLISWLPALIGAAGGLIGSIFGHNSAKKQQELNFKQSKELARYQADLQKEQFDYTNAYNTPQAQVERLKEANLNPLLMSGSPNVAASMPSVSQPHMNQQDPMALAQYQLQFAQMAKDLYKTGQEISKTIAEKHNVEEDTESKRIANQNARETQDAYKTIQGALATEKQALAEIAKDNMLKNRYDTIAKRDLHNVTQLVTRGSDGDFFFDYMPDNQREFYLRDLSESDLYNSVKSLMQRDKLSVDQLKKNITILNGEIQRLPYLLKKYKADAAVAEFQANLAEKGINPNDPMWARILVTLIPKILKYFSIDPVKATEALKPFGGTGKTPSHEEPYMDW